MDDGDDDMDDQGDEEHVMPKKSSGRKSRSVLTSRGVTLSMLLNDKILEVGEKCLSIDYLVNILKKHNYYNCNRCKLHNICN